MPLNIPVVLGSVRENRNSYFPAKLMVERLKTVGVESQIVDFKELPLPFFDSPLVPVAMKGVYPNLNVQKWSEIAKKADAFVLIVSEYNHGYSAVLKNALDWLYLEFEKKPFGLCGVSDGSFGGIRAVEQLRPVIENFGAFAIREVVAFSKADKLFNSEGFLKESDFNEKINRFLKSLLFFTQAIKEAMAKAK